MCLLLKLLLLLLTNWIVFTSAHVRSNRKPTSHLTHDLLHTVGAVKLDITPAPKKLKPHRDICKEEAVCVPPVQCPAHVRDDSKTMCHTTGGRKGVCCTTGHNHTGPINSRERGRTHQHLIRIDPVILGAVTRHSRVELADLHMREVRLLNSGRSTTVPLGTASYGHFRNSKIFNTEDLADVLSVANRALEIALATRAFKDRQGVTVDQLELSMIEQDLSQSPLGAACTPFPNCPPLSERYRRLDGACNNIYNTKWGSTLTPYARLLPPSYHDGIWMPRVSEANGQPLVSARVVSTTVFDDLDKPHPEYTLMLMQFGQYLAHEITQSLDMSYANGSAISCCTSEGDDELPYDFRHFACMPILIPQEDPFYSDFKQGCMNFVRTVLSPRQDCTLGYAQQMNKVTHFIDGSTIYGSNHEQTRELRSFVDGKLRVFNDFGRDLLPLSKDPDACLTMEQGSACFSSGDTRTNQMISLVALHTIFMREHNRVADVLKDLNPHWEDEQLFLEARRIVVAELQVIVYKEFLPAVLGEAAMEEFDLNLEEAYEYSYDYDQRIEPSVVNEFGTAAFRFGHSTVSGLIKLYGSQSVEEMVSIPEIMFHPARLRKRQVLDEILSALTTEPIQEVDSSLSETLTKYMFRAGNPFGVDLAALNIQRGRDHGLRPYNDYRELVGQARLKSFDEYPLEMAKKLSSVYSSVDDIDLWVGGLLEPKAPGSILGLTFRDIVADQFVRLKKGDKYFFEHDPSVNPEHFTPEQLFELRKSSMSRLVCDNSDGVLLNRQGKNAFRRPDVQGNNFVDCSSQIIPRVNLIFWKEPN